MALGEAQVEEEHPWRVTIAAPHRDDVLGCASKEALQASRQFFMNDSTSFSRNPFDE